jgi:hypothetical protein
MGQTLRFVFNPFIAACRGSGKGVFIRYEKGAIHLLAYAVSGV